MPKRHPKPIITEYARMWPRTVFDILQAGELTVKRTPLLGKKGVYVLYIGEQACYIGQPSKRTLYQRLHDHANKSTDRYFDLWDRFSAFVVDDPYIGEVEAILIAAIPTANSAAPKIKQVPIPKEIRKALREARHKQLRS